MTDSTWEGFLKQGEQIYEYFTNHFDDMFESNGDIKRFDMRYMSYLTSGHYEEIMEKYGEQVHKEIIPWIHEEHQSGRLFHKEHWKPFRDQLWFTNMYYGYRKLFCFQDYFYFQLAVERMRYDRPEGGLEISFDFRVALYGWKEKGIEKIQPDNQIVLQDDMMMPERHWIWH